MIPIGIVKTIINPIATNRITVRSSSAKGSGFPSTTSSAKGWEDRRSPVANGVGRKSKTGRVKAMGVKEDGSNGKVNGSDGKTKVRGVPSSFG